MALLALYCGLRFGEIAHLEWHCVDFTNAQLLIKDPKSRMNRTAFLTSTGLKMLEERKENILSAGLELEGLIFTTKAGGNIKGISKTYKKLADDLFNQGITDPRQRVCFHTLRHTFASWLVQKGIGLYEVKELMGHADFKMTQRYAHLSPEGLRKAVKVLE